MKKLAAPSLPSTNATADWISDVYDFHISRLGGVEDDSAKKILQVAKLNASLYSRSKKIYAIAEDVAIGLADLPSSVRDLIEQRLSVKYDFGFRVFLRKSFELAAQVQRGRKIVTVQQYYRLKDLVESGSLVGEALQACQLALDTFEANKRTFED